MNKTEPTGGPHPELPPTHPGQFLREISLPAIKETRREVAAGLGMAESEFDDFLDGAKPASAELAVKISKMFGGSPESWLRMQEAYDLWHARREVDVSQIPRVAAAE